MDPATEGLLASRRDAMIDELKELEQEQTTLLASLYVTYDRAVGRRADKTVTDWLQAEIELAVENVELARQELRQMTWMDWDDAWLDAESYTCTDVLTGEVSAVDWETVVSLDNWL